MSLKAKLEAVIYAAEEPVTLNQLAALFAADALEWKAAQEAAAAEQTAEVAGVSSLIEIPGQGEHGPRDQGTEGPRRQGLGTELAAGSDGVVTVGEGEGYDAIVLNEAGRPEMTASPEPVAEQTPVDAESEAKRLARQRDREVKAILKQLLDELVSSSQTDGRGVAIREIAGGYRMATKPECHDAVRMFVKSLKPPLKLSLPALETLAVIAYKQPVTAPEVSEIRGVESAGVLGSLLARKLIATAGRKQVIGRPILYKTTKEFLLRFGLKDVSELPSMEEFEKMAATELEMEPEAAAADAAEAEADAAAADAAGANQAEQAADSATVQKAESNAVQGEASEAALESNSPSGEELAGAAEAVEGEERPADNMAAGTELPDTETKHDVGTAEHPQV